MIASTEDKHDHDKDPHVNEVNALDILPVLEKVEYHYYQHTGKTIVSIRGRNIWFTYCISIGFKQEMKFELERSRTKSFGLESIEFQLDDAEALDEQKVKDNEIIEGDISIWNDFKCEPQQKSSFPMHIKVTFFLCQLR